MTVQVSVLSLALEIVIVVAASTEPAHHIYPETTSHELHLSEHAAAHDHYEQALLAAATANNGSYPPGTQGEQIHTATDATAASNLSVLRALRPLVRVIRVVQLGSRALRQGRFATSARHVVGGNKRRFREAGFDLDLVRPPILRHHPKAPP
jgi:hypothetical protein